MDLSAAYDDVCARIGTADAVVAVGARTQWEVGDPPPVDAVEVRAPAGIVAYDPADMTVTVAAGTSFTDLDSAVRAEGQECALDPRAPDATVGGILAAGLSGIRRLRHGPVRDHVLEVRFVTGDGRLVKGGGPTVKNVTGYDLPRLLVGSLGTLGVLVQVTLRLRPRPATSAWTRTERAPSEVRAALFSPAALLWDGRTTHVLLEGYEADVEAQRRNAGLDATAGAPALPEGPHRGRISARPGTLEALTPELDAVDGCAWIAERGVGTVHVACDAVEGLAAAREAASRHGGWLLREAGGAGLPGFGCPLPTVDVMRRLKTAFDPDGKLGHGRLPL